MRPRDSDSHSGSGSGGGCAEGNLRRRLRGPPRIPCGKSSKRRREFRQGLLRGTLWTIGLPSTRPTVSAQSEIGRTGQRHECPLMWLPSNMQPPRYAVTAFVCYARGRFSCYGRNAVSHGTPVWQANRPALGDLPASVVTDPLAFSGVRIDAVSGVSLRLFCTLLGSASSLILYQGQ